LKSPKWSQLIAGVSQIASGTLDWCCKLHAIFATGKINIPMEGGLMIGLNTFIFATRVFIHEQ